MHYVIIGSESMDQTQYNNFNGLRRVHGRYEHFLQVSSLQTLTGVIDLTEFNP
jgi:hypothetical protein